MAQFGGSKAETFQDFLPFAWEQAEVARRRAADFEESKALLEKFKEERKNAPSQ